ncbi:hypothetical protein SELMODRAFT_406948 [Selaginella moellendorffii]|uniref:Uncharacterized protein n=1 Tax=Selaginella moellendorffii TaxID=88036 RepID=D8R3F7_SELML|nr:hypothetical protein SELMODRAFT_406948 [Selaginella moellendorffii]
MTAALYTGSLGTNNLKQKSRMLTTTTFWICHGVPWATLQRWLCRLSSGCSNHTMKFWCRGDNSRQVQRTSAVLASNEQMAPLGRASGSVQMEASSLGSSFLGARGAVDASVGMAMPMVSLEYLVFLCGRCHGNAPSVP